MEKHSTDRSRPLVLLVHGTFARDAPWTLPDSPLSQSLKNELPDSRIQAITWSGNNSFRARLEGGEQIADAIKGAGEGVPIAIIAHSHGGSAVAYAMRQLPKTFDSVRAIVCLATPFFGFSVRPGYQSLLLASVAMTSFLFFQLTLAAAVIAGRKLSPRFDEDPYLISIVGILIVLVATLIGKWLWGRRAYLYKGFEQAIKDAERWDTTQTKWKCALFTRSMGDEVGLGLGSLQFASTVLNKVLNTIATVTGTILSIATRLNTGTLGKLRLAIVLLPLIVVSALPAAFAVEFGYEPQYWIDLLNPWSDSIIFFELEYGILDQAARIAYLLFLLVVAVPWLLLAFFFLIVVFASTLGWLTTGALGKFSLRLAIATQWAIEPTPEGAHTFLNGGWSRDASLLASDRIGLQHSDPYSSPTVVNSVVKFVAENLKAG